MNKERLFQVGNQVCDTVGVDSAIMLVKPLEGTTPRVEHLVNSGPGWQRAVSMGSWILTNVPL